MVDIASGGGPWARLRRHRRGLVTTAVVLGVLALNLLQQPGLVTFDTKADLQFDAAGFLGRSLDAWNADWTLGGLQNQASGYLFPMGPAFWVGEVLHVPMWIWERLWSAGVMLLAYAGVVRLARSWPGIGASGAVLAGLTYMLAPRVLTTVGGLSGETLPSAILPWTVLPLVLYLRGRLAAPAAFVLSAATIPWMGGQNATLVVACLILPGLLLLLTAGRTWLRRVGDATAWTGLALVASLWWLVPLYVMAGYSPPFLDFIESARDTASRTGWLATFRGTDHWVAFIPNGGNAGWVGGYALATSSVLLFTTVLVAGAGLVGLAQPGLWARRVLVLSMLVGLAVLTLGSAEPAGSVLGGWWLGALDTWLAPLRNVHKFDPLIRLPLSLGLGAFAGAGVPQLVGYARRLPARGRTVAAAALTGVLVVLVGAAAQPAASGDLRTADGAEEIATSWQLASSYLRSEAQEGPVGALVLPGVGFAVQSWGRTVDEPIQVLSAPAWASRGQSVVAPAATLRLLDSIESQLIIGRPLTGIGATLRRMGITHVVLRNDLDPDMVNAPPADLVRASLTGSPDLVPVAEFGTTEAGPPAVEVFALADPAADPRVSLSAWDERVVVQGGPEAVDDLAQLGLLADDEPVVLAGGGDEPADAPLDVVTDSNRRVERSFGRITDAVSGVMTAEEEFRLRRPAHDYTGGTVPAATTVAAYDGAVEVTASTSGGYADVLGPVRQDEHPYAAFDSSGFTAWTSALLTSAVGQWIEVRFDEPIRPGPVRLIFDDTLGAEVTDVRLSTDAGYVDAAIGSDGLVEDVELPEGATTSVRMTVLAAEGSGLRPVQLADFHLEGLDVRRTLVVPGDVAPDTTMVFRSEPGRRACVASGDELRCSLRWQRETPETAGFDRTVTVAEDGSWRLAARAVATNGPALDRLFEPLAPEQVRVAATSTYAGDPAVVGANAFDGREDTSWYAPLTDREPGLQLTWSEPRRITRVLATLGEGRPGALPPELVVDPMLDGEEPQTVMTSGERAGVLSPVRTTSLRISAPADPLRTVGVGIGELEIDGLDDLRYVTDPGFATGVLCGFGPTLEVAGRTVQTEIRGTLGDVARGAELSVWPCEDQPIDIPAGTHRIRVTNPQGFAVSRLFLTPAEPGPSDSSPAPTPDPTGTDARVLSWGPTSRTVAVSSAEESLLTIAQSENPGWAATLEGQRLDPVTVDGWKQGWRIPAGAAGDVRLEFTPQTTFQWGIVVGLVLAGLLQVAAVVVGLGRLLGRRAEPPTAPARAGRPVMRSGRLRRAGLVAGSVVAVAAFALVSVPLGVGAVIGFVSRRLPLAVLSGALAVGLLVAAAVTAGDAVRVLDPPDVANVIVAIVVGVVAGRVLLGDARPEPGLA